MSDININPEQAAFLHDRLNRVARTFALLPPFLEANLGAVMSAAYLVCRVVDSIEDCQESFAWKQQRFNEVRSLLSDPMQMDDILTLWTELDWPGLNPDETALMKLPDAATLWEIYGGIPDKYRQIIGFWVTEMADGMEGTLNPAAAPHVIKEGNVLVLRELEDYNKYCYYVAGTVGYLQTELLQAFYQFSDDVADTLRNYSLSFSLGLQKTNIVKDFLDDLNRGMCYLPYSWLKEVQKKPLVTQGAAPIWIQNVLVDVKNVLDEAVEYISTLPYKVNGVRQATLMCLLPAYQTILLAAEKSRLLFTQKHHVKISHKVLATCFEDAQAFSANNQLLRQYQAQIHERFENLLLKPDSIKAVNA
ncbi:MAG: squalene/phytoene synthase family protein [Ardenticatenaceae bacterium]|nr:squalene/phytoene synthase family protein [Ardenticatenaceae bacterium]